MKMSFAKILKIVTAVLPVAFSATFAEWNGSAIEPLDYSVIDGKKFYTISTPEQLAWVGSQVRNGYSGINVILANDIVFGSDTTETSSRNWTPIGKDTVDMFAGTFDGAGHTIYGLHSENGKYAGLFGTVGDAGVIKNLRMVASKIVATDSMGRAGGIVARNWGVIDSCVNEGSVQLTTYAYYGGGLVGSNGGVIRNSLNRGEVVTTSVNVRSYVGGIAAFNVGTIEFAENQGSISATAANGGIHVSVGGIAGGMGDLGKIVSCVNKGSIIAQNTSNASVSASYSTRAGGIVAGADAQTEIAFCENYGEVKASSKVHSSYSSSSGRATHAGGIVGALSGLVSSCENHGTVYSENSYSGSASTMQFITSGGIVGVNNATGVFSDCYNDADVVGKSYYTYFWIYIGGVNGQNDGSVERCENVGNVFADILSGKTSAGTSAYIHIGGVIGGNREVVRDCYNLGNVTSTKVVQNSFAGGVSGSQYHKGTSLTDSYSAATSVVGTDAGGVVGYNVDTSFVQRCYFDATVLADVPAIKTTKTNATAVDTVAMKTANMKNDNFAWILNTANGNETNRGVWSRMSDYPVIANDSAKAIYRVFMDNDGELSTRYAKNMLSFKSYPQGADGYTFVAWLNEDGTPFVSGSAVSKDMTLTALYSTVDAPVYMVTFFDDHGKVLDATLTNAERKVDAFPDVPEETESGIFVGWFDKLKNLFNIESVFSANAELTATYEVPASSSSIADESSSSAEVASSSSINSSSSAVQESSSSAKVEQSSSSAKVVPSSSSAKSSSSVAEQKSSSSVTDKKSSSSKADETNAIVVAGMVPQFSLAAVGRSLQISGAKVDSRISVLDVRGNVIYSGFAYASNIAVEVANSGSYLVRVGNQIQRVNVK